MIIVTGHMRVDASQRDAFIENAKDLMTKSRAEKGCGGYAMCADPIDPEVVLITEQWESSEAIDAHMASDHFVAFGGSLADFTISEVDVIKHEGATSSKLM